MAGPSPLLAEAQALSFYMNAASAMGCNRASDALRILDEEMEPFAEKIRGADIASIAGLRGKTLVAIWDYQPLSSQHDGYFELDHEESHWSLFSGAVAVTGLSGMVDVLQTRLELDATVSQEGA